MASVDLKGVCAVEYKKLKARIRKIINQRGWYSLDPEDAAHNLILNQLQGKSLKRPIELFLIDELRAQNGRVGTEKHKGNVNMRSFEKIPERVLKQNPHINLDALAACAQRIGTLSCTDRAILLLYSVWGFKLVEVGYILGVSESRISQRLKLINNS